MTEFPIALKPDAFAEACQWIVDNHEGHEAHRMLDRLVTALLTSLGYGDGMDVFLAHVREFHGEAQVKTERVSDLQKVVERAVKECGE